MTQRKLFALLVSGNDDFLRDLKSLLKEMSVEIWSVHTYEEAARLLDQTHPELIFTATEFSDGTWKEIVALTERTTVVTNVIVVGRHTDTDFYLSTMDYGAFDFLLPPFETAPIAHVVRVAGENARRRSEEQARKAVA